MERIITGLLLFGAIVVAAKLAILLLILAGLIFRTKETLGLLLVLGGWHLLLHYPLVAGVPIGILVLIGIYKAMTKHDPSG